MRKRHYILTLLLMLNCTLHAQHRSSSKALSIARDFLITEKGEAGALAVVPKVKMATPDSQAGLNSSYIVNDPDNKCFVLVSADERMLPVLGYSDNGTLNLDEAPEGLLSMLQSYERQYNFMLDHPDLVTIKTATLTTPIAPLIQTTWGQGSPYNDQCPAINGTRCATGCVATSMAQIMNYYQYPNQCQGGTFTYTSETKSIEQSLNYDEITFDWSKMLNDFSSSSPSDSKTEIAKLLHACGVSVSMDYNTSGSGAFDPNIPYALKTYFGYASDICYKEKMFYSSAEWEKMIQEDLKAGRPLFYGGEGSRGGHSFILDGVNESGLYHFNFGWYGRADGYFALDAINPKPNATQYDFNDNQTMVCKVAPESFSEQQEEVFYGYTFSLGSTTINVGTSTTFEYGAYCYASCSTYEEESMGGFTGEMGIGLYDSNFNYTKTLVSRTVQDLDCCEGLGSGGSFTLSANDFKDGNTYYIAMYVKGQDSTTPSLVHHEWGEVQCYKAEVGNGVISLTAQYDFTHPFNLTISDAGISTLYLDYAVDLPDNPNLLGVFYVYDIVGSVMYMKRIRGSIPANTGVIIMANKGTLAFQPTTDEVESITDNVLLGTTTTLPCTSIDGTVYTLGRGKNSGYMGFHKYTGTSIPANKCYMVRNAGSSVNTFTFDFEDATAIKQVEVENTSKHHIYYDLQGRRIDSPSRGIYILNGRKIFVK